MIFSTTRILALLLFFLLPPLPISAQDFDCAAYENYPGLEPEGYAENCLAEGEATPRSGTGSGLPDDRAYGHELRNTRTTVFHNHEDLSDSDLIGSFSSIIFGYDYSADLSTLYGINWGTNQLGTTEGTSFTPIGIPTRPELHTWSGLAIDPITGEAYLSSTNSEVSTLQTVNLETGESTLIGNMGDLEIVIEIAINCEGTMYAHDIGSDAIYIIDRTDGTPTLVGAHGLETNFAQGMDFNNDTGELFIYAYTGGGSITYGRVNLANGQIIPLNVNDPVGEWEGASRTTCPGMGPARFKVTKDFDDDNPAEVAVTIECNTGLPLMQSTTISEGEDVTFVVDDFIDGEMSCEITETVPDGYSVAYFDGETSSPESCRFEEVELGSDQSCDITNSLQQVEIEVTKVWVDDNPQFQAMNHAEATWSCSNVAFECEEGRGSSCDSGNLEFVGNPGTDQFSVFPAWDGGTLCSVQEISVMESGIEINDEDCASLIVFPGGSAQCTIINTRLYEGIPSLGQYGLVLLALLILGVGLIGIRHH